MLCPVCNGLRPLRAVCPTCGGAASDTGRPEDWLGPYSPYEPGLAEGDFSAAADGGGPFPVCRHQASCDGCGALFYVSVARQPAGQ